MSIRRIRLILHTAAGLLILGAVTLGWWAWDPTTTPVTPSENIDPRRQPVDVVSATPLRPLEDFAAVWSRPLRGPLVDPPAPTPKPKPNPPQRPAAKPMPQAVPAPQIQLIGTIIEEGRSVAFVTDRTGKIDLKGEGEMLELTPGDIRIERIGPKSATVSYRGQEVTLELKKNTTRSRTPGNQQRAP